MVPFDFKSDNHFVASSDGTVLQVYELTKPTLHSSSIRKTHWKEVVTINISVEEDDDDDTEEATKGKYDGLLFFDGHGRMKGQKELTTLAIHLKQLHLLVSPKGYCFQQVYKFGMYVNFGVHYLRLNDLFSWPRHGIELTTTNVWSRLELKYNLPRHENSSKRIAGGGRVVSMEKYVELERSMKKKDQELEKLKEEMDEAIELKEEELQQLKKGDEEQRKQIRKKDNEVRMLRKKKDDDEAKTRRIEELDKLNEDMEEANKTKDEEFEKLAKEKYVGMQKIIKKKDDELRSLGKKKDDSLEKLKEEMDEAVEELRKTLQVKDNELRMFKKEVDSEDAKARRLEELEKLNESLQEATNLKYEDAIEAKTKRIMELEKLKEEMEYKIEAKDKELREFNRQKDEELHKMIKKQDAELLVLDNKNEEKFKRIEELEKVKEEELEQCRKKSWSILPSTRFLPQSFEVEEQYLTRRQCVPPETFNVRQRPVFPYVSNSPKLVEKMIVHDRLRINVVDEERSIEYWPPLPTLQVHTAPTDFDKNEWWYLKNSHPEGGLTMLVYYDGKHSQITTYHSEIIPLPFPKNAEVYTLTQRLSFFDLYPFGGVRLGFTYRG